MQVEEHQSKVNINKKTVSTLKFTLDIAQLYHENANMMWSSGFSDGDCGLEGNTTFARERKSVPSSPKQHNIIFNDTKLPKLMKEKSCKNSCSLSNKVYLRQAPLFLPPFPSIPPPPPSQRHQTSL